MSEKRHSRSWPPVALGALAALATLGAADLNEAVMHGVERRRAHAFIIEVDAAAVLECGRAGVNRHARPLSVSRTRENAVRDARVFEKNIFSKTQRLGMKDRIRSALRRDPAFHRRVLSRKREIRVSEIHDVAPPERSSGFALSCRGRNDDVLALHRSGSTIL